ncbi:NAD(P)H-hydrate dehydratase [Frisingicoccus sp.]|uniref:NAD(P)H-hydrate dehydratase n=1 Tax=Frisingicoccus sp. TaxID=1918627 RepID=UPI002E9B7035|nr:NAD(P)H-hydrate dehydratase [Frisingicoccus sp.]
MKAVVTGSEMKTIDTYTIQEIGIPSLVLMERAALSMAEHMKAVIGKEDPVLCVCGAGNNGGDGVAVARILFSQGYKTAIYMAGPPEKWTEETKKQIQIARNTGVPEYNELDLKHIRIVVDGLFGIGLSKNVRPPYDRMIDKINVWKKNHEQRKIWSVDIPSGLSSDTGQVLGCAVKADYTVTFGYMKCGMILYPGRELAGTCFVKDIGFSSAALEKNRPEGFLCNLQDLNDLPERRSDSNKGDYGKILVVAGSKNMSGAAYFSGYAAYAAGAGLVRILTPEANRIILQTQLPQAMISVWEEMTDEQLKSIILWADAVVIGPGIGTAEVTAERIRKILPLVKCPMVIDADGLNLLAKHREWYDFLGKDVIVTPHMGEMSRLTGKGIDELKADRARAAKAYAKEHGIVCVLKDSSTVVSDGTSVFYNQTGNHGMATGGSGDVLSGIIGAYTGSGVDSFRSAYMSAFLHGCAGDEAAKGFSARGMTSVEIIEGLIQVLKKTE